MKLERSLISFDCETTGTDVDKDRIVQIAAIKTFPDGTKEEKNVFINPEIPIPQEASDVHGITNEMVKDAPTFKQLAVAMHKWFEGSDICGFNSDSFDVLLLVAEMERAGVNFLTWEPNFVDVRKIFQKLYPNTLSDVYKRFLGKDIENAHDALSDILCTNELLEYFINEHPELNLDCPKTIDEFCQGDKKRFDLAGKMYICPEGIVRWNFSKNKDLPVLDDQGFISWFMKQDFPQESKNKLKAIQK